MRKHVWTPQRFQAQWEFSVVSSCLSRYFLYSTLHKDSLSMKNTWKSSHFLSRIFSFSQRELFTFPLSAFPAIMWDFFASTQINNGSTVLFESYWLNLHQDFIFHFLWLFVRDLCEWEVGLFLEWGRQNSRDSLVRARENICLLFRWCNEPFRHMQSYGKKREMEVKLLLLEKKFEY